MHLKRRTITALWPVERTGTKYLAVSTHNKNDAIPLLVIMRDVLNLVKTKKEMKKVIFEKKIMVNGRVVNEENYPISLFDTISIPSAGKHYRATLKNKRMKIVEINSKEADKRIYRVIGKKILPGKKMQLNLNLGRNIIVPLEEKIETGSYILMNTAENKIVKIIPLKKDIKVLVIAGKHTGKTGKIKDLITQGEESLAEIKTEEGEIKANINNIFVEEN